MSTAKKGTSGKPQQKPITPLIGSLLRLPREVIVARMFEALNAHGFDITLTELNVFMFPGPEGQRPIDLARQCNMTRQAMNYVLSGLERRGYIERHAGISAAARVIRMTDKGWEVVSQMRRCVIEIEQQWTKYLGAQRFKTLSETLRDLSQWLGKLP
jgi:DNA-binding MarR family transcriptional regulator